MIIKINKLKMDIELKCSKDGCRISKSAGTQHGSNVILQHPVALHRSDFVFCFYAIYVTSVLN
jgi:hypothetical protein